MMQLLSMKFEIQAFSFIIFSYISEGRVKYRMAETGSVMTLMNVTKEDSGQFTCVANNGVPAAKPVQISKHFYLLVRRK